VMHKQTILVMIEAVTNLLLWAGTAIDPSISLLVTAQAIITVLCVWFMFRFADEIWNKILNCCCRCCCKPQEMPALLQRKVTTHSSQTEARTPVPNSPMTKSTDQYQAMSAQILQTRTKSEVSDFPSDPTIGLSDDILAHKKGTSDILVVNKREGTAELISFPTPTVSAFPESDGQELDKLSLKL